MILYPYEIRGCPDQIKHFGWVLTYLLAYLLYLTYTVLTYFRSSLHFETIATGQNQSYNHSHELLATDVITATITSHKQATATATTKATASHSYTHNSTHTHNTHAQA